MPFRILEISHPAELHVQRGQLIVEQVDEDALLVPLEDLYAIVRTTMARSLVASLNNAIKSDDEQMLALPQVVALQQAEVFER